MGNIFNKNKVKCYKKNCNGKLDYIMYSDKRKGFIYSCTKCHNFTIIQKCPIYENRL